MIADKYVRTLAGAHHLLRRLNLQSNSVRADFCTVIAAERFLPSLLGSDAVQYDRDTLRLVAVLQAALCIGALLLLWFRRNCVLDLRPVVLAFTLVLEVTMKLPARARFDVGRTRPGSSR